LENLDWIESTEFPEVLNPANNGLSVDVLVYCKKTDEHTIGWFNFNTMTWNFLCRESVGKFKWRYFQNNIDKWK
jgi:hypothetical protein